MREIFFCILGLLCSSTFPDKNFFLKDDLDILKIVENRKLDLELQSDEKKTLWRGSQWSLQAPLGKKTVEILSKGLFLVNLGRHKLTVKDLTREDLGGYWEDLEDQQNYALFFGLNPTDLESLASWAHTLPGSLACGRVFWLGDEKTWGIVEGNQEETMSHEGPIYRDEVTLDLGNLWEEISQQRLKDRISFFETMGTRGHNTESGIAVPDKILHLLKGMEAEGVDVSPLEIKKVPTSLSPQDSLILALPGQVDNVRTVVLGAHMDTILGFDPHGLAPGADDDASGMATLLEVLQVLLMKAPLLERRVEWHFYAGEEVGLLGSKTLSSSYRLENKKIVSMFQVDMDSFSAIPGDETVYLVSTDTSPILVRSMGNLCWNYFHASCPSGSLHGGTSDHRSWKDQGYPVVFPFENPSHYNRALHTALDTQETAGQIQLMEKFTQLALAYVIHYGGGMDWKKNYFEAQRELSLDTDLKIAFLSQGKNSWKIGVSGPKILESVHICYGLSSGGGCLKKLQKMEKFPRENSERNFFVTSNLSPYALKDGDILEVGGYDSLGKKISLRRIRLQA